MSRNDQGANAEVSSTTLASRADDCGQHDLQGTTHPITKLAAG
jgi:hypothetical protein